MNRDVFGTGKDMPSPPPQDNAPSQDQTLLRKSAVLAAQSYLPRWHIETFLLRIKQDFNHFIPGCATHDRILKVFKDNFKQVTLRMQVSLSGLRALLKQATLRFISGRPKKPPETPENQPLLFDFA
jgi:hypothetical protein